MIEPQLAESLEGALIFLNGKSVFRVYSADRKAHTDYVLRVDDSPVKVLGSR